VGVRGVIVTQSDWSTFWPATDEDVARFERVFWTKVQRGAGWRADDWRQLVTSVQRYSRQYVGIVQDGRRELWVLLVCDEEKLPGWGYGHVDVMDGGACFADAYFDVETERSELVPHASPPQR
jgi:hypothetical protein